MTQDTARGRAGGSAGRKAMLAGLPTAVAGLVAALLLYEPPAPPGDAQAREAMVAQVREVATRARLEHEIAAALDEGDPDRAEEYFEVAGLVAVPVDPALHERWVDETSGWKAAVRTAKRTADGFLTGEGEGTAGIMGALASDLTVVGDVRDLGEQAARMIRGESVDELAVGLSMVGVALTAGTVATAGTALPAKTGISVVKLARRTGRLTAAFQRRVGMMVARSADLPAFRAAVRDTPWYRLDELSRAAYRHAAGLDVTELRRVFASLGDIGRSLPPSRTLALLRHVDDVEDLRHAERATRLLGKPVSGALRLTGKALFRAFGATTAITMALAGALLSLGAGLIGLLSFLFGAALWLAGLLRLLRRGGRRPAALLKSAGNLESAGSGGGV
ncbi:hypothetical protein [Azospirillum picis]|uniref:Transcriptional regulator n=1 Tax=Azospirillum picis TaxID=488438 RepID=A0ABU0MPA0_9PROT|nr:hypothetical protein [Azospirillum picis]MBP2301465.1 hypothetical protein [Azospirillum picis]MDQ0535297.1 hypothetical protein [Azospirillum picis]